MADPIMSKSIKSFEDLRVWQCGIELVKEIYLLCRQGKLNKDFGLRDQLCRAAVSIPTNIAEGFERASRKEYLLFLNIAKGSAGELRSLLRAASEVGYIEKSIYEELNSDTIILSRSLAKQIAAIKASAISI